ncbi:hypothetical protein [Agrobacterium pusense]|uniref:Uncharacterized protein n=1 Tax=Agrobacterium pusense TaxID=648995 RepID=A0AA44ERA3_9HYPH|nr:hypothetical protein [Agrobacterium pusense]NRF12177.1 hypothetical protein [Agrobacterium pusense]NRF22887.1 hypothetical protein [Agrobacterium pusense]
MGSKANFPQVTELMMESAKRFDESLLSLGLAANLVTWAVEEGVKDPVLVLVTDFFDLRGPLDVARKIFDAYNASALPAEIDPFIIRLHSIQQPVAQMLMGLTDDNHASRKDAAKISAETKREPLFVIGADNLVFTMDMFISRRPSRRDHADTIRRWKSFSKAVDALAA